MSGKTTDNPSSLKQMRDCQLFFLSESSISGLAHAHSVLSVEIAGSLLLPFLFREDDEAARRTISFHSLPLMSLFMLSKVLTAQS